MAAPTLEKPVVPGMKQPVSTPQTAEAGLPLALTYLYPEGVKVFIDPPPTAQPDDTLVLRLNGDAVAKAVIMAGEENQRASLYVRAKLWQDGLNTLEYGLERATVELETSYPLRIWFHSKRPGLVDRFPEQDGHSELALEIAQSIRDEGVNAERAREGVDVALFYPLMRAFDTLLLDCNGVVLSHVVTQAEADLGQPLVITIDEATFIAAGDSPDFRVSYTVLDCVGNGPDTNNPDSASQFLYVNLKGNWYEAPIISEDPADAEDDPDTIDLQKLDGRAATAQVYVSRTWLKGDEIQLSARFRDATGSEGFLTLTETVKNTPFMYSIPVPNKYFAVAAGGTAVFYFTRVSGGIALDRSEAITVSIVGAATSDLPPPTLVGSGYELDPLGFAEGVYARVDFKDAGEGDMARLVLDGVAGLGSPHFQPVRFNQSQRARFLITPQVLAANHGKTMKLSWELIQGAGTRMSAVRDVIVRRIEPADRRLPSPDIPQSLGNTLDLGAFTGPGQATCKPWPAMAVGQLRWFRVYGTGHDDLPYEIPIAREAPVTAPEVIAGLDNTLPRELLLKFKPGSMLSVELRVAFAGNKDDSEAVLFQRVEYEVLNLPATLLEDFALAPAQAVKKGGVMETASLQFTFVSGSGECAIMPRDEIGASFPGRIDGQVLSIGRDAFSTEPVVVELELKKACTRISFWQVSVNYENSVVEYFSADKTLLGSKKLGSSYGVPMSVLFAASAIKTIRINCPTADWFSVDRIKVDY
ncbi:hypothetical protein [Pseudomonas sp. AIG]